MLGTKLSSTREITSATFIEQVRRTRWVIQGALKQVCCLVSKFSNLLHSTSIESVKVQLKIRLAIPKFYYQGCYESRRDYRLLTVTSRSRRFWAVSSTCTGTTTTAGLVSSTCTGTTSCTGTCTGTCNLVNFGLGHPWLQRPLSLKSGQRLQNSTDTILAKPVRPVSGVLGQKVLCSWILARFERHERSECEVLPVIQQLLWCNPRQEEPIKY